jgi:NAD dependent epimerase/dehydratase family enzyme
MSWIHIDDAGAATVAALERGRAGHADNVVDDEPVRWGEFLGTLAQAINAPPPRTVPGWLLALAPYGANHDQHATACWLPSGPAGVMVASSSPGPP